VAAAVRDHVDPIDPDRLVSRRLRALLAGLAVVCVYAVTGVISGHLSPIARRPILDGLIPTSYRWVNPPPDLAGSNIKPSSGRFSLAVWPGHSQGTVFSTNDAQVTVIVPKDSIPYADGQRSVDVTVQPLDPAKVGTPKPPLAISGNAYRITGTYRPSGDPLKSPLVSDIEIVLLYPALTNVHGSHTLLLSTNGRTWSEIHTNDLVSVSQADGQIGALGYVAAAVTGEQAPMPTIAGGGNQHESFPVAIAIGVVAVAVLLGGLALGIRNARHQSGRTKSPTRRTDADSRKEAKRRSDRRRRQRRG
jgi:hypothetical protein